MDLKEAIIHAREVAAGCPAENRDCAYQHDKLADWLEELRRYRELGPIDRLRELKQADDEGRCVVLPVKPGTPVWSTALCRVDEDGTEYPIPWTFELWMVDAWGKEWFLTREEAEAAIRRERDG